VEQKPGINRYFQAFDCSQVNFDFKRTKVAMYHKVKILWAVYFLLGGFCPLLAQQKDSSLPGEREWIEGLLKQNKVPAVGIGIIKEGALTEIKVYGELKKGTPAPYNTIFNVASLTKPVVAMLTLTLVNKGLWKLDEPLSRYWTDPDVVADPRSKTLTSWHVLTHQTGFMNWRWLHKTKKLTFDVDPGTKFGYSGEGFEYLKHALEHKFRKSLIQLVDTFLFSPLQMSETKFVWDSTVDERRFALWHDAAGNNAYTTYKRKDASAADDLLTTIEDYGKFSIAVLKGFGISPALFKNMVTPHAQIKKGDYMGLGWEVMPALRNEEYAMLHTGSDQGVQALVILLPLTKEGMIIMTNSDNGYKLYYSLIPQMLSLGKEIMARAN